MNEELLALLADVVEWAHEGIAYERAYRDWRFSQPEAEQESAKVKAFEEAIRVLLNKQEGTDHE
jgi:hypothetical protein